MRKGTGNPVLSKGPSESWDRDRVAGCEVHRLPDGRYVMFYIGFSDVDTALLDAAVAYYRHWEKGFKYYNMPMGGDGKGGFLSIDDREGTEMSLGGNGYKPLLASAMWSEATAIAAVAKSTGRNELAAEFAAKAAVVAKSPAATPSDASTFRCPISAKLPPPASIRRLPSWQWGRVYAIISAPI